jgi:hypothetical protein
MFDFADAAHRHWDDGELLANPGDGRPARPEGADQAYGFAAENALKALLVRAGIGTRLDGDISNRGLRVHIDRLWDEFQAQAAGRTSLADDAAALSGAGSPFQTWSVSQRYWRSGQLPPENVRNHRSAASLCLLRLQGAAADGGAP